MTKTTPRAQKRPGHFVGADACRFFKHDHVGRYCISTIGDYHPRARPEAEWEPLGYYAALHDGVTRPARYETAVFDLRAKRHRWQTLALDRCEDETTAKEYHAARVLEYTRIARRQRGRAEALKTTRAVVAPPEAKVGVAARRTRGRRA